MRGMRPWDSHRQLGQWGIQPGLHWLFRAFSEECGPSGSGWEAGGERANDALLTEIILKPVGAQRTTLSGVMCPMLAWGPHRGQDLVQAPSRRPLYAPGRLWAEGSLPSWPLHRDQEGRSLRTWRLGVQNRGCVAPGFSHRAWETWMCSRGDTVEGMTVGVTKWQWYGGGLRGTGFVTNWRAFLCPSFPELSLEGFSPD